MHTFQRGVIGLLGILLLIVVAQSVIPSQYVPQEREPVEEQACIGTPIRVEYAFNGGYLDPWACEEQCGSDQPRYVLYSNGKATQCETPPGCNDFGEDNGITCIPPDIADDQASEG